MSKLFSFLFALLVSGLVAQAQPSSEQAFAAGPSDLLTVAELAAILSPAGTSVQEAALPRLPGAATTVVTELLDPMGQLVRQWTLPVQRTSVESELLDVLTPVPPCALRIGDARRAHTLRVAKR